MGEAQPGGEVFGLLDDPVVFADQGTQSGHGLVFVQAVFRSIMPASRSCAGQKAAGRCSGLAPRRVRGGAAAGQFDTPEQDRVGDAVEAFAHAAVDLDFQGADVEAQGGAAQDRDHATSKIEDRLGDDDRNVVADQRDGNGFAV